MGTTLQKDRVALIGKRHWYDGKKGWPMMRGLWRRKAIKLGLVLAILALVLSGGLFAMRTLPQVHADAFTGCHGKQVASAQDSASGYTLTVAVIAQFGNGGEFGTGYCGSMKTSATMSVPASGVGGTLTVTLVGDTTGSVTNSYPFPNASPSGGYTFTEYSPSSGPKCGVGTATFTSSTVLTLSATTNSACPGGKK
jgi:hypothetical protein